LSAVFGCAARIADKMTFCLSRFTGKRREGALSKVVLVQLPVARYHSHTFAQALPLPGSVELESWRSLSCRT
jgi:hypothetical protein